MDNPNYGSLYYLKSCNKLERAQRKYLPQYIFFFRKLKFSGIAYHHSDALFLINAFSGSECCPSVLETAGIRTPARNIRNFSTFTRSSSHCSAARCVSAANAVWKSTDIFRNSRCSIFFLPSWMKPFGRLCPFRINNFNLTLRVGRTPWTGDQPCRKATINT
jgi:hypothetical protein